MKILSLFDGIACGYEALLRAGIKVDAYYASEIDKYAIQIAQKNHSSSENITLYVQSSLYCTEPVTSKTCNSHLHCE